MWWTYVFSVLFLGYQPGKGIPASCEKNGNLLTYQSYVRFIQSAEFGEDTYFDTLKETLMARDIVKHGTWVSFTNFMISIFNLNINPFPYEYSCEAPTTMNNYINKL